MHYHCEVWLSEAVGKALTELSARPQLDDLLANVLNRYSEETNNGDAFYDWYQVGGRNTGTHDGYHPWEDPVNMEVCDLCGGTGTRTDAVAAQNDMSNVRGCNGCHGDGVKVKYSSAPHKEDVIPLKDARKDLSCYTLILIQNEYDEPTIYHMENWTGKDFVKSDKFTGDNIKDFLAGEGISDGYLVTLDYHN